MQNQTLYILCGLPFAGKTTFAKELVKRFGFIRVSVDEINGERGIGLTTEQKITPEQWQETFEIFKERIEKLLRDGNIVIADFTAHLKIDRDTLRSIAGKQHAHIAIIYFPINAEDVQRRWQENRQSNKRSDIREDDFNEVVNTFQKPTAEENVIMYDGKMTIDEWTKLNNI